MRPEKALVLNFHKAAVTDVKWSQQVFKEHQIVKVKFHPHNFNLFLSGGSKGLLKFWDVRSGKVNHEYVRNFGPILDVEFSVDGKNLITSSDVSESNLIKNSIIVWHVSLQIPLSNQAMHL
ncbi:WD repeat-containing 25 [Olea europaea subsp. europaea]|uniref:WD repeat-containing 25 n=1 Tax=Olea europaea subsp. europaea TaxID=158383 RepID=A0A8S0TBS6_OLEEU|nr:WD repeat-containing 25 [Olea europaea subsp. europaea]